MKSLMMMAAGKGLADVFSPPHIADAAKEMGLAPGESMDLLSKWDFDKTADRKRAIAYIKESRPFLVVGTPPCTLFSVLQFEVRKQQATRHVEFCATIYSLIPRQDGTGCTSIWQMPLVEFENLCETEKFARRGEGQG